jgi:hypothetical protein
MTADRVRGLSTNAREIEKVVGHRSVSGDKRGARRASEEVTARVGLDSNKLAVMRKFKDGRQPLAIRGLSPLDQIVVRGCNV